MAGYQDGTILAKVVSAAEAELLLADDRTAWGGRFDPRRVGGVVVRGGDVVDFDTPATLRTALGYDRWPADRTPPPPVPDGAPHAFQIRWRVDRGDDFPPSFGAVEPHLAVAAEMAQLGGRRDPVIGEPPFLGTGYTPGGLPEAVPYRPIELTNGAELWRLDAVGGGQRIGVYAAEAGRWFRSPGAGPAESRPVGHRPPRSVPDGKFAVWNGVTYRAARDQETGVLAVLYPVDGTEAAPGTTVHPQDLTAWYDTWTRFVWRDRVFTAVAVTDDRVTGRLCNGSASWAVEQGLDVYGPEAAFGDFARAEITELDEVRIDLLAEWRAAQPGPSDATKAETAVGRWLLAAMTADLPAEAGGTAWFDTLDARAEAFPLDQPDPLTALWSVVEDLIGEAFSGPGDEGVPVFCRELGGGLAGRSAIRPADVLAAVLVVLGHPEAAMPEVSGRDFVRLCLNVGAWIARFRSAAHVEWLVWRTERAMADAGRTLP